MFSFYNEDCYEFMKTLPDKSVDLILTNPPYEVSGTTGGGSINKVKKLDFSETVWYFYSFYPYVQSLRI